MTKLKFGDVVLLRFPFTESDKTKKRPALVLLDTNDGDFLVSRITSKLYFTPFDVEINNWKTCNLKLPSVVRIHKMATLNVSLIDKILSKLDKEDIIRIKQIIKNHIEEL
ncbi:MAG: type II toxin-antitoxin system PemK/MazF family toxin [Bacteroidota bacterium]